MSSNCKMLPAVLVLSTMSVVALPHKVLAIECTEHSLESMADVNIKSCAQADKNQVAKAPHSKVLYRTWRLVTQELKCTTPSIEVNSYCCQIIHRASASALWAKSTVSQVAPALAPRSDSLVKPYKLKQSSETLPQGNPRDEASAQELDNIFVVYHLPR